MFHMIFLMPVSPLSHDLEAQLMFHMIVLMPLSLLSHDLEAQLMFHMIFLMPATVRVVDTLSGWSLDFIIMFYDPHNA